MKNSLLTSGQFWWQEEGQLTSADVSYQMVGCFGYKNVLFSYVQYIWVSFQAKSKITKRYDWLCMLLIINILILVKID